MILASSVVVLVLALPPINPADEFPPSVPIAQQIGLQSAQRVPLSIQARPIGGGEWEVNFTFGSAGSAKSVALAGDFNSWSPSMTPLQRGDDGIWRVTVRLPSGERFYKFVVDSQDWRHDPQNSDTVDDGHGGRNSVLRLGPLANLDPSTATLGDGEVNGIALAHDQSGPMFLQRHSPTSLLLRYRTLRGDVEGVRLATDSQGTIEMGKAGSDETFDWWETALPETAVGARYTFVCRDGKRLTRDATIFTLDASSVSDFRTPEWAKDAVWYQVMLDRFRDGDPSGNAPNSRPWKSHWQSPSPWEGRDGQTFYDYYVYKRLYGGDLSGLRSKLQYLKSLGVNALYLNPVFQAASHHKYEATNYLHIDEHFGVRGDYSAAEAGEDLKDPRTWTFTATDQMFLDFLKEAKAMGFRVIIDGVFNHVGVAHPAFKDVRQKGAESRFKEWFAIRSFEPFVYEGWAGFGDLPAFAKTAEGFASDEVKQHIMDVTQRWMDPDGDGDPSDGIDGWRLDVPNEIAMPFWREWRAHVKSINPDAYIVGEVWRRADAWLDGQTLDAVMNYPFADTVVRFIGDRVNSIPPSEVDRRLAELRRAYPSESSFVLQNLLDSHDTDRLVSKMFNPDREFDAGNREQSNPEYRGSKPDAESFAKARLAALMQMTYLGAPMIYYGDEVGMWGSDDPNNRRPMVWDDLGKYDSADDRVDADHLSWYRRIVKLRNDHPALRRGSYELILADDRQDVLVFRRSLPEEELLVAINASDREAVVDLTQALSARAQGEWRQVFPAETSPLPALLKLPGTSGAVWVRNP